MMLHLGFLHMLGNMTHQSNHSGFRQEIRFARFHVSPCFKELLSSKHFSLYMLPKHKNSDRKKEGLRYTDVLFKILKLDLVKMFRM